LRDGALDSDRPDTSGTATVVAAGPLDTTRLTRVPDWTCAPAPGLLLITRPLATVLLAWFVTAPTARFCPVSRACALAKDRPVTLGTASVTTGGPLDTTRPTAAPGRTYAPEPGLLLTTRPLATVVLGAVVTTPTARLRWAN